MSERFHVGVGASGAADAAEVLDLIRAALAEAVQTGTVLTGAAPTETAPTQVLPLPSPRSGTSPSPGPPDGSTAAAHTAVGHADNGPDEGGGFCVAVLATVTGKERAPAIAGAAEQLGVAVVGFDPAALARVAVPTPSEAPLGALGTPSVAEAAALLAAGPGAELALAKRKSAHATVAVARASAPSPSRALEHKTCTPMAMTCGTTATRRSARVWSTSR